MEILSAFSELGGNFIDTSDRYGATGGESEAIIGKWLTNQQRDSLVLATKCFFETSPDINGRGLSRKHILKACDESLKRLNTDYIDLYQAHMPDPFTPLDETLRAFDTLVEQGKVRYIGFSNFPAWQLTKASYTARKLDLAPLISGQYLYNLLKRDIEAEVLPACADNGIGVICWSPLSGGVLTGKYQGHDSPPSGSRFAERAGISLKVYREWQERSATVVNQVSAVASLYNTSPTVVSLAWLLQNERVASVLVGAKDPDQIREACLAADWELPENDWKTLEHTSRIKHPYPHAIYDYIDGAAMREWRELIV
jgi:aryl-alcohol dehydrogenase-like predicted oxidoreductase